MFSCPEHYFKSMKGSVLKRPIMREEIKEKCNIPNLIVPGLCFELSSLAGEVQCIIVS